MRCAFLNLAFFSLLLLSCQQNSSQNASSMNNEAFDKITVTYPFSRKDTTVKDTYFGQTIADPYRWLEDDQSAETKDWVQKQNLVTFGYLSQIPYREALKNRLQKLADYEKYSVPFKKGGKYYYFKNAGLQNQSVFYVQETLEGSPKVVLDPNSFSADGTSSLQEMGFSKDGRYLAYAISKGGSDWRTILVKDLQTGQDLPDRVEWAKFTSLAWKDNGFYYTRYPTPKAGAELTGANKNSAIYFHRLGTDASKDALVYEDKAHPDQYFGATTTEDERFLILSASESTSGNSLKVRELSAPDAKFVTLVEGFDNEHSVVDNLGDQLLIMTNYKAPKQQLVLANLSQPAPDSWKTFVPEDTTAVLQSAEVCGGRVVCHYLQNASSVLRVYESDGRFVQNVVLPEIGSVGGVSGEKDGQQAFFGFTSFLRPFTVYTLDMPSLKTSVFKAPIMDFNPDLYTTEQVWYTSKDGTKIPMFITGKKGLVKDGQHPTLLYGYGGFNVPLSPSFSAMRIALLENDGVYAMANIRGGGEFGERWHKAGTKCQKQNVFDDFIAAAEYLNAQKYTNPARLAIQGGSNGGLLVGACMTQRPDLFAVCFPQVGVLDMLRYHKFTIGYAWAVDYGRSDSKDEFPCLLRYSPLHNVRKTAYPATMVTTADHDDRVVPAHSFKFAATLQEHQQGNRPVLIRIDTSAGHGAGKPTSKQIEEVADTYSFMFWNMRLTPKF